METHTETGHIHYDRLPDGQLANRFTAGSGDEVSGLSPEAEAEHDAKLAMPTNNPRPSMDQAARDAVVAAIEARDDMDITGASGISMPH